MFESIKVPTVQGRRALLVINCQKDAFSLKGPQMVPNPPDFLERIQKVIPYYRKVGTDIVWVTTDIKTFDKGSNGDGDENDAPPYDLASYLPSSRHTKSDGGISDIMAKLTIEGESPPRFKRHGPTNELVDDLNSLLDVDKDIRLTKSFYSAFDNTPLLMALRMKMVTNIHLCGALSNASIISTAFDAVQHGFEVSVLEDCMAYRSETQHLEAMQKMADSLGVLGVDSEEIVEEAGGRPPPDADPGLFLGPGISGINIAAPGDPAADGNGGDALLNGAKYRKRSKASRHIKPHTGPIGEGDSHLHIDTLSPELLADGFEKLKEEVEWLVMRHRTGEVPRLVAVQGEISEDGSVPIYRHPADESPPLAAFTETVRQIRDECTKVLKQPFNHVLVQLYRDGQDNISEHSDKTLDIVRGSDIVNVSLGAQRVMTLRLKRAATNRLKSQNGTETEHAQNGNLRQSQKIPLPHGSIFVLGPKSNTKWLHGIRADKRPDFERSEAEKAYESQRISLTFRNIGTFTDAERTSIWGQGARSKSKDTAGKILSSDSEESEKMVIAFGRENQTSDFDWDAHYGAGFDALDLVVVNKPEEEPNGAAAAEATQATEATVAAVTMNA